MKKLISILILSVITLACTFGLVACECKHEFTNYLSDNNATCLEDGTKTATCDREDCEVTDTVTDTDSKLGHKFTNYVSNNDATCLEDGTKTATCDREDCEVTDTVADTDSKLGHKFTNYVSDNNATYEADGTKTAVCDRENCEETDTIVDTGSKLESKVIYDFEIVDGVANITVSNDVEEYDFNTVITSVGLKDYIVGLDKNGTQTSLTKKVDLSVGDNSFYIFETLNSKIIKTIKVIVHRNYNYNVTFEGINAPQTIEEGSLATIPEVEPTKAGYTFSGWDFDFNTKITANTNIVAIWTANSDTKYKVEYYYENIENNGYTKVESETEEKQGTTDTVVSVTPKTVEHFTFNSNLSTLSGNLNGNGSLVLKVYYKRNVYTISFNADGGNRTGGGALTQTIKYGASATAPTLIKTGYTLDGYDKEFNNVSANLTVTAKWKINQYTLTIVYNNGTANKVITQDYNSEITGIEEPKRGGYTFAGWDKQIPSKMPAQNITITAKWNAIFTVEGNTITGLTSHGKTLTEIVIPESIDGVEINAINEDAFRNCDSLTSVTIGDSVTSIGYCAFYNCSSLTSITIPDSVISLGGETFAYCHSLTSITIGDGVTSIGNYAFSDCTSLTSITIPNSVTSIGEYAFAYCGSLTSVMIPDSVTSIGSSAFYGCSNLTIYCEAEAKPIGWDADWNFYDCPVVWGYNSTEPEEPEVPEEPEDPETPTTPAIFTIEGNTITGLTEYGKTLTEIEIPESIDGVEINAIGDSAFANCLLFTSVTIGDRVTSIGYGAFTGCSYLSNVTIGKNVKNIGITAFALCNSLNEIVIPSSVTTLEGAFYGCEGLSSIIVEQGNQNFTVIDGNLYTKDGKTLIQYALKSTNSEFEIPNGVTGIGIGAFAFCKTLNEIIIPNSVTNIGRESFYKANNLQYNVEGELNYLGNEQNKYLYLAGTTSKNITTAIINSNCKFIGFEAFAACSSLTDVTIPNSVTSIDAGAFYNCYSLTSVVIPDSVTSIGDYVFRFCNSLTSVTIPNSVTSIGSYAFQNCDSLTSIIVDENNQNYKSIDSNLYTKDGKTLIKYATGKTVTDFVIPNSVTNIGEYAFAYCDSLTSVTIGNSVTSIGDWAFYDCYSLTSVTIGDSVTSIGEYAFAYCDSLTSVTIGDSVTSIGRYAFAYGDSLTSVTIGNSVTSIGSYAFQNCDSLTSIIVDENNQNYKSIDGNLYTKDGKTLIQYAIGKTATDFVIPNSVTSIGDYAFYNCTSLTSITIPDSVTSIGSSAFIGCSSLVSVTIGKNVEFIDGNVFRNCDSLTEIIIDSDNESYILVENNLYSKDGKVLLKHFADENETEIIVPDGVEIIGEYAFENLKSITSVTLPNTLTTLGAGAFYGCSSLINVNLPDGITKIEDYTFYQCVSLEEIVLTDNVISIGRYAFDYCNALTTITIPNSVIVIDIFAFSGCEKNLIIYCEAESQTNGWHNMWTSSKQNVVWDCKNNNVATDGYEHLYVDELHVGIKDGTATILGSKATLRIETNGSVNYLYYSYNITEANIPKTVNSNGNSYCVTAISANAFKDCKSLTSVTIPSSVITIGNYAFRGCSLLTIYCEAESMPSGWDSYWNYSNCPVVWGYVKDNPGTNVGGDIILPPLDL